jgi:hypothetical protein
MTSITPNTYKELKDWIDQVRNDPSIVKSVVKGDRKNKLEPLSRIINMKTGKHSWSFHWKEDTPANKILRDPSTRSGFEAMKTFIVKNSGFLREEISPKEYLHALGYDNISTRAWGGVKGEEIFQFANKDNTLNEINSIMRVEGCSKTKAKQTYNKRLYELLPSFEMDESEICNILGIRHDYEDNIVKDPINMYPTFTSILEGEAFGGGCVIS